MDTYVRCERVEAGLRPAEVTVAVASFEGGLEYLRVSGTGLLEKEGQKYLGIGVIHFDPITNHYLIEFPEESDSGASRVWVPAANILTDEHPRR